MGAENRPEIWAENCDGDVGCQDAHGRERGGADGWHRGICVAALGLLGTLTQSVVVTNMSPAQAKGAIIGAAIGGLVEAEVLG